MLIITHVPQVYINWWINGTQVVGFNSSGTKVLTGLSLPVSFPGTTTQGTAITMTSSSVDLHTLETFTNVRFYLGGDTDQLAFIQGPSNNSEVIPWTENITSPGGVQISFDGGKTFTLFDQTHGYIGDPSTWIILPEIAVGTGGADGVLGPYDMASMIVQVTIPELADQLQMISVNLNVDFDVI